MPISDEELRRRTLVASGRYDELASLLQSVKLRKLLVALSKAGVEDATLDSVGLETLNEFDISAKQPGERILLLEALRADLRKRSLVSTNRVLSHVLHRGLSRAFRQWLGSCHMHQLTEHHRRASLTWEEKEAQIEVIEGEVAALKTAHANQLSEHREEASATLEAMEADPYGLQFQALLQSDSHAERIEVFRTIIDMERKRLAARQTLQSMFKTD